MKKRFKIQKSETADRLVKMITELIEGIDEEMRHGCYSAPDYPPPPYDEEEDYLDNQEKIVDNNVALHIKLKKFINRYNKIK